MPPRPKRPPGPPPGPASGPVSKIKPPPIAPPLQAKPEVTAAAKEQQPEPSRLALEVPLTALTGEDATTERSGASTNRAPKDPKPPPPVPPLDGIPGDKPPPPAFQDDSGSMQGSSRSRQDGVSTKRPRPATLPADVAGANVDTKQLLRAPPAEDPPSEEEHGEIGSARRIKQRPPPPSAPSERQASSIAPTSGRQLSIPSTDRSGTAETAETIEEPGDAESATEQPMETQTDEASTSKTPTVTGRSAAYSASASPSAYHTSRYGSTSRTEQEGEATEVVDSSPQRTRTKPAAPATQADLARCGRLSIRCLTGKGFARDEGEMLDISLGFRLGGAAKFPWKNTEVHKKVSQHANFQEEIIVFDIPAAEEFVQDGDMLLDIQVNGSTTWTDDVIATATMSVWRYLMNPFRLYSETIPLKPLSTSRLISIDLDFVFEEARKGMLILSLIEGRNLRSSGKLIPPSPFVSVSLTEKYMKTSAVVQDGGRDPYFAGEEILLWMDGTNWLDDIKIKVFDDDLAQPVLLGSTQFSLLPYFAVKPDQAKEEIFDLTYQDEFAATTELAGELVMKITFLEAGVLEVVCMQAKNLGGAAPSTRMDPYLVCTAEGQAAKISRHTHTDKDGGADPQWNAKLSFDIVDQYLLDVAAYNQEPSGSDTLIGNCQVSLLPVFKTGSLSSWFTLKTKTDGKFMKEAGDVYLSLSFDGPTMVGFPQHRPGIATFDDSGRGKRAAAVDFIPPPVETKIVAQHPTERDSSTVPSSDQEFTREQIEAAFNFIDLDKNGFVGASEIRHILVCMGEIITDEEIDMMISMVDIDGDGQVSFEEFHALVIHPDPATSDFARSVNEAREAYQYGIKPAQVATQGTTDARAYRRQKDMAQRERKRTSMITFVREAEISFADCKRAWAIFSNLPPSSRVGYATTFETLCSVFQIEPIGEYLRMFNHFDADGRGTIEFRQFMLGLLNFVEVEREDRIRFTFDMYNEHQAGYLTQADIEAVVAGNHMISASNVQRKVETIMKQAKRDGVVHTLSLPEFVIVSKKFPNILFPASAAKDRPLPPIT